MLDDLNENNDNLTENNSTQEENNSPLSNDELENNADETLLQEDNNAVDTSVTEEVSSAETNTSDDDISTVREADNSSALSDGDGNPNNDSDDETAPSSAIRNEENNSISADLIRGHINTIILRALLERDKYGYEIINDIESKSHGQYTLKQPTLYSALKRLENQGYIKAYWKTDEVTLGGRRKYFTLTESGKAITEKNLSEWEYSRTIIDSLISDKSFDFARPAPSAVDFTLLRDSVSRVPTARGEEKPASENAQQTNSEATAQQAISQHPTQTTNATSFIQAVEYYSVISDEKGKQLQNHPIQGEGEQLTNQVNQQSQVSQIQATQEQTIQGQQPEQTQQANQAQGQILQQQPEQAQQQAAQVQQTIQTQDATQAQAQIQEELARQQIEEEAARRRTHENYMRLISEPVRRQPTQVEDTVPGSDNIDSDKLLYNNRPETERDYKNLVDGIFFKTINHGSVQTTYHSRQAETVQRTQPIQTASATHLVNKGASDGVSITPSNERNSARASKTTYNKGKTLLKSSAVVFAILIIEAILCYVFKDWLSVTWIYPAVILGIGVLQFSLFLIMALNGFGKRSVIPTSHGYVSTCIILTIILELIIAMLAFLLNVNMSEINDIMIKLVIPAVTALNLTVFGLCYKAFIKRN